MLLGTVLLLFQAAFSFATTSALAATSAAATADERERTQKVILLVIDALPVEDFIAVEWANLRRIASNGVIGLMNSRTAASPSFTAAGAHATIGSGARSPAGTLSGYAFDTNAYHNGMPVTEVYSGTTGNSASTSAVAFLGMPQLQAASALQSEGARPGALGQRLAAKNVPIALIGNADVPDAMRARFSGTRPSELLDGGAFMILRRHGALIAMDERGLIPFGTVDSHVLTYDADWPYGVRTDYDAVWHAFVSLYELADLIVVELGDFARLDLLSDWISPERLPALRRTTIARIDQFIGRLALWPAASGATVAVISPSPPMAAVRRNFLLTPFVWTRLPATPDEDGALGSSLATSRTTRRGGIVTNTDITASVLAAFGDVPSSGRAIHGAPGSQLDRDLPFTIRRPAGSWETVALLYERATSTHSLRAPVVRTFIVAAITVFVAWVAWMLYVNIAGAGSVPDRALNVWRWLMLLLSAAPLAMLLLPVFPVTTPASSAIVLSLLTGVLATLAHVVGRVTNIAVQNSAAAGGPLAFMDAFIGIALVTAAALLVDVWVGAPLIKSSVLGYDPIVGARFYGIGNEFMGVLIGTTLIGTTGWLDRLASRRAFLAVVLAAYALVCFTLVAPALGANVGGTIAAVIGFGLTAALLLEKRLTWKTVLIVCIAAGGVLTAAAAFDLLFRQGQLSHLGQTVQLVQRHGVQPLLDIIIRKLSMNAKLLRWTIWAQVFIVSLGVSALALYRPAATVRRIERRHPMLLHGIRGAVIAALVALVANDSGVVAAATLMIPATATLMYLVLLQRT